MRNYLKYLNDTMYSFQRKYDFTENQLRFLLFINDEKKSFTKKSVKKSSYFSRAFYEKKFPDLVKRDYIFVFDRPYKSYNLPNKYRVTNKTNMLVNKFYNVLEGTEEL